MAVREYKSSVFSMLMENKEYALQVYNALNDSNYTNPEEVEILLLRNTISLSVRNDASFIVDAHINIYEHQSTYNPNMALRCMIYYGDMMKTYVKNRDIFSRQRIMIPTPHFKVFYNGTETMPERQIMKLSDSLDAKTDQPELELVCEFININPGNNLEFMEKCCVMKEYMTFVGKVAYYKEVENDLRDAIVKAIDQCIEENVLQDFLKAHRNEVLEVMTIDMTWERREDLIREEERNLGKRVGEELKCITLVCKKIRKDKTPEEIADDLEEDLIKIKEIYDEAVKHAPGYDAQAIYDAIHNSSLPS